MNKVKVIGRIRPLIKKEEGEKKVVYKENEKIYCQDKSEIYEFEFDSIYDENSTQDEIYENEIKPIIKNKLFEGYNSTIFCYGSTGIP
jgi:hypothetical protein